MYRVVIHESEVDCLGLIVLLTGRGQSAEDILIHYRNFSTLSEFTFVSIQPIDEWYPMPQGAKDQMAATSGLNQSVPKLDDFITELEKKLKIDRSNMVLAGFSAGAVMSIQVATHTDRPFKCVVSHNGAILEPEELPHSNHSTKYLMIHNEDDKCFSWDERYLPMKQSFLNQGYDLKMIENDIGGHFVLPEDIKQVSLWIREQFGTSEVIE